MPDDEDMVNTESEATIDQLVLSCGEDKNILTNNRKSIK